MPQFHKTVFANGLTLVSERLPNFRSLSMGIWVKVGTRHESVKVAGASHFLEHMLFKGTKKRTPLDIAVEVDQVGGEFNAFTGREQTCFHLLLLDRDFRLGIEILSDVILNPTMKANELERERKVILQEISMVDDSPEELAYDLYFEKIYGSHGLGKPILGTQKSINRMKRPDLVGFFYEHYRADQIVVSVAGNVSHDALKDCLKPLAQATWPGRPKKRLSSTIPQSSLSEKSPVIQSGFWWETSATEQVHLIWGVQGPTYDSQTRFAALLLNTYLGGGMSSTLFQEIREKKGLAYTVYSNLTPFVDSGIFSVYAATRSEEVPLCLKLIEKCIQDVVKKPLSKKQLSMVKENLKGMILISADSSESRMSAIAKNEIYLNHYYSIAEVCREIDRVSSLEIQEVACELFGKKGIEHRSVLALGPKPSARTAAEIKKLGFRKWM